ncbi:MAG: YbhB/YbcL family Raf kinase inhibitor-like protein [Gammaproteobacteria bacterium]
MKISLKLLFSIVVPLGPLLATHAQALTLTSSAFANHGALPARFTCKGAGISPPLAWHAAPHGTQGYALILSDPDAPDPRHPPTHTYVHWVVAYLPAGIHALAQAQSTSLPSSSRDGVNSTGHSGYTPPCPPAGRHHYIFTLYALDTAARLTPAAANRAEVLKAITPHVLAQTQLIGTYQHHPN